MGSDDESGTLRLRSPNPAPRSARCAVYDTVEQLELLPLVEAAVADFAARRRGPPFGEMVARWIAGPAQRYAEPGDARRCLEHLAPLFWLREFELTARVARDCLRLLLGDRTGSSTLNGQKPKPLSAGTVNKVHATARRLVRDLKIDGDWFGENPFQIVPRQKERGFTGQVLSVPECQLFLPHLRRDRFREAAVELILGPRPGELKAIRREDIDRHGWFLTWRRSNDRDTTKTGRWRKVPIPASLIPIFEEALRESRCELVFPKVGTDQRQRRDAKLSRTLRTALAKAGICCRWDYWCWRCEYRKQSGAKLEEEAKCPGCGAQLLFNPVGRRLRWYDLRHCAATLHREAGCDPHVIAVALGHSEKKPTGGIYTHVTDEYARAELSKLKIF